jgi:hypothetical protein
MNRIGSIPYFGWEKAYFGIDLHINYGNDVAGKVCHN